MPKVVKSELLSGDKRWDVTSTFRNILSRMAAYAFSFVFVVLFVAVLGKKDSGPVTCGSVIKLQHKETVSYHHPCIRTQLHLTDVLLHRKTIYILMPLLGDLEADSSQ
jgi:hypothetical protein